MSTTTVLPSDISNNSFSYTPVDFDTVFAKIVAQYNSDATIKADTSKGSTLWAIFKSVSLMFAEQSQQIVGAGGVINISRLASCIGSDVDSFCAQFNIPRLPAIGASGQIVASVNQALSSEATLYVGQLIGSNIGTAQFIVIPDTTNPAFSLAAGGYVAPAGTTTVTASVKSTTTGYASNVQAGELTLLLSSPLGVVPQFTRVTNLLAFTNGKDAETDADYKARFIVQQVGGGTGTALACVAQALQAETNLTFAVGDPWNYFTGLATVGYVTIILGSVGSGIGVDMTTIATAQANVNQVRSAGIITNVVAASVVPVSVGVTVKVAAGYNPNTVATAVQTAIATYLNTIPLAGTSTAPTFAAFGRIYVAAFSVPGVIDVPALSINGAAPADVQAAFGSQIVAGPISVTGTY